MLSFGELAQATDDIAGKLISGSIDLVCGTGFSSMDAAISKTLTENNPRATLGVNSTSVLDIVMRIRKNERTRIYNGREITVGNKKSSYPNHRYTNRVCLYCYVEF